MRILGVMTLLLGAACGSENTGPADAGRELRIPELGPVPALREADEAVTAAQIQLGANIYFDTRLSGSGGTSCNSCHVSTTNYQDSLTASSPDRSAPGDSPLTGRSTPSLLNVVFAPVVRWDGSHSDLVEALALPFAEPNMNTSRVARGDDRNDVEGAKAALLSKFRTELPGYTPLFRAAYSVDVASASADEIWRTTGRALRAYLTEIVSRDSPFDRWNAGDDSAMDDSSVRGLALFRGSGRCVACHSGPLFTDFQFHNLSTSVPQNDGARVDEGRYAVTKREEDRGRFLTPTLRQAYDTGPYFHDGSQGNLRELIRFLSSPAVTRDAHRDPVFASQLELSDDDITDLISFVRALRGTPPTLSVTPQRP